MRWPEIALGQVEAVHPSEYAVSVVFPNLGMLTGIRVPVAAGQASRQHGSFALPQRGDWGIVAFFQNDPRSARWLTTLTDAFWHAAPLELLTEDPDLRASFERCGRDTYRHGNGDVEVQFPDGSLLRLTHDGEYDGRTQRQVGVTEGAARTPKRVDPDPPPERAPAQVYFEQKNGLRLHVNAEGTLKIELEGSYLVRAQKGGQVELSNVHGAALELDGAGDVLLKNGSGAHLSLTGDTATLKAGTVVTDGPTKLGSPGAARPVARLGDTVSPTVITSGSSQVTSD